jgi:hypothetical protein
MCITSHGASIFREMGTEKYYLMTHDDGDFSKFSVASGWLANRLAAYATIKVSLTRAWFSAHVSCYIFLLTILAIAVTLSRRREEQQLKLSHFFLGFYGRNKKIQFFLPFKIFFISLCLKSNKSLCAKNLT